jgi:hypothetical protein
VKTFRRAFVVLLVFGSLWIASARSAASRRASPTAADEHRTVDAAIRYVGLDGRPALASAGAGATLYILVDSRCGHCEAELRTLLPHSADLAASRTYVLTTETGAAASGIAARWPQPHRDRVTWGTMNPGDAQALFHTLATPVMLVVDSTRRVHRRFVGETRPEALITAMQTAGRAAPRAE